MSRLLYAPRPQPWGLPAGFMPGEDILGPRGVQVVPSANIYSRGEGLGEGLGDAPELYKELRQRLEGVDREAIQRGDQLGDLNVMLYDMALQMAEYQTKIQRDITSSMTAFPVRENLEAVAKILVPVETPLRNRLARVPGAGKASAWKQATSLGGGWATNLDQPGSAATAQYFFAEAGAPDVVSTVYADVSATYKLAGTLGKVN